MIRIDREESPSCWHWIFVSRQNFPHLFDQVQIVNDCLASPIKEKMIKNILLITLILFCFACSKTTSTKSTFVISLSKLSAGLTFNGGGLLQIKNVLTGEIKSYDMTTTNVVALPSGTWDMFFVGFQGTSPWQGPHLCGGVSGIELSEPQKTVVITANAGNCSNTPYVAMITSKGGSIATTAWDDPGAQWDDPNTKWGP